MGATSDTLLGTARGTVPPVGASGSGPGTGRGTQAAWESVHWGAASDWVRMFQQAIGPDKAAQVVQEPFPHVVLDGVWDKDLLTAASAEFDRVPLPFWDHFEVRQPECKR
jgi:hypothetical protein